MYYLYIKLMPFKFKILPYLRTKFVLYICCLLVDIHDITVATVSRRGWKVEEKFVVDVMKLKTNELGLKRSSHGVNYIIRY